MSLSFHKTIILAGCGIGILFALLSCSATPEGPGAAITTPATSPLVLSTTLNSSPQPVKNYTYKIIHAYPHDTAAFTQGLAFEKGYLYEGTGQYQKSSIRQVDLETGSILKNYQLPDEYWGEGITVFKDTLVQLTYRNNTGFIYDKNSFAQLRQFSYPTEGWGLTSDGSRLIMSDGSSRLYFFDPITLEVNGNIEVMNSGMPVKNINELEYIHGLIYANIWPGDKIAIIDPLTGRLIGWLDLTGLLQTRGSSTPVDVLNGIAFDPQTERLWVTGKWWPFLFEIQQIEKNNH
jgi:glutaminyl-peptide cyclotransferase